MNNTKKWRITAKQKAEKQKAEKQAKAVEHMERTLDWLTENTDWADINTGRL